MRFIQTILLSLLNEVKGFGGNVCKCLLHTAEEKNMTATNYVTVTLDGIT